VPRFALPLLAAAGSGEFVAAMEALTGRRPRRQKTGAKGVAYQALSMVSPASEVDRMLRRGTTIAGESYQKSERVTCRISA